MPNTGSGDENSSSSGSWWRPPWLGGAWVVLASVVGAVLLLLGQDREDAGDWAFLIVGVVVLLSGAIVQVRKEVVASRLRDAADEDAILLRLAMKDALQPVVEHLATMAGANKSDRTIKRAAVAVQAVNAVALLMRDVERLRAVVYAISDDQQSMTSFEHISRGGRSRPGAFKRGTERGDRAFSMLESKGHVFVKDLDAEPLDDWGGTGEGYKTFISARIAVSKPSPRAYGMLTVDAPEAGSLTETDLQIVLLMADLLAIAFACEAR